MTNLQTQIGNLSPAEKFELIDVLWESLEADVPAINPEQEAELDDRIAKYDQNPAHVLPWEQVKARLLGKQ